ncbi:MULTISPECIES: Gfo/Idh/MocA family protein [Streptomyces]|uniref:Gfo/Idh/MocA family oxidoreductase n=1 Tax=Streptomyces glycanivorans TaxID=3033808 RepID=A0ABY9J722_9ACTN|nr:MULTISPECIES: Gfo/Idh/MocA family oxidoreductase [unclassified Streptomyces]WLQ63010.1 Gfo/Idh/MocA family oxidoreductase [Streptomyces sp. Alt3]WSQ83851.1 Gfo/Idh/MocA family oxidoreductase [Streptomyces sp. NBC_01212]WSR10203.1 Gfo/Idh/MocA family oxidoreductase [Streptomyces sp. NBC_01208]WSR47099.1 Gfo/Idh/MocA family oxidoreductase [Streptomyces sp. NBC_01201]
MTDVRLGLIGAGAVGLLHSQAAAAVPGVSVSAVCDIDADTARDVAGSLDATSFTDHRDLIGSGLVDAVVINTPHALHTHIVTACAAAGLHVLVEKPMATGSEDCALMERACLDAGTVLFVGHIQHYLPPMTAAKAALDAGVLGAPLAVTDWRSTDYRRGSRPSWFFDPAVSGGGVFINIGTHCVDRLMWLTGRRVVAAHADAAHRGDIGVETDVVARLELAGGLVGQITVTSALLPPRDELTVIGERGTLRVARGSGAVLYPDDGSGPVQLAKESPDDVADAFRDQLAAFVAAVRGQEEPAVPGSYGRQVIQAVEGVYASCASGTRVTVPVE